MNGPNPISFQDILAWKNLYKVEIHDYEIEIIKRLDHIYLSHNSDKQAQKRKSKGKK